MEMRSISENRASRVEYPGIEDCIMCRTCSSSCPVTMVDGNFNPLKVIRSALLEPQQVIKDAWLWMCSSCYSCQERCPQGIRITDIIVSLKNRSAASGFAPQGIRAQLELIVKKGRVYPLDEFDNKKRTKLGLPELPLECRVLDSLFETSHDPGKGG